MPRLPISFPALTENDKCGAEVFDVCMSMMHIGAPNQLGGLAAQDRIKDTRAHCGANPPGTKEVAAPCCSDAHATLSVRSKRSGGDFSTDASLACVSLIGCLLGHWLAIRITIHIGVFNKNQLCAAARQTIKDGLLQKREFFRPLVVWRLRCLIHHLCCSRHFADLCLVIKVCCDHFHSRRHFVHFP